MTNIPRTRGSIAELQRMEAEWTYHEMHEFVRLIQRYRSTYVTAIFLSVGWVLGQMLAAVPGSGAAAPVRPDTLDQLRQRPDIAVVLCVIPLVNVLFVMLMLEANAHVQNLARYRFLLGIELGAGNPVWRWEIWKTTHEGSVRSWTNPANVFFTLVAIALTAAALWFSLPAAWNNRALWWMWLLALSFPLALLVVVSVIGLQRLHVNDVADPCAVRWSQLRMQQRKPGFLRRLLASVARLSRTSSADA